MNKITKWLSIILLVWFSADCVYRVFPAIQKMVMNPSESDLWFFKVILSDPSVLFSLEDTPGFILDMLGKWAPITVFILGAGLFALAALRIFRTDSIHCDSVKHERWFLIMSGAFVGTFTHLVWQWLPEPPSEELFWATMYGCLVAAGVFFLTCLASAASPGEWKCRMIKEYFPLWTVVGFAATTSLDAIVLLTQRFNIRTIDPLVLLAIGAFLVFAWFFPKPAAVIVQVSVAGLVIITTVIFSIVGSIFGGGRR